MEKSKQKQELTNVLNLNFKPSLKLRSLVTKQTTRTLLYLEYLHNCVPILKLNI